ncbi:hypothetical protein AB0I34_06925 [Kribbella sp. NPDC050281]|uniref:hypothetical protein n=1 Tax=Kribbella sp. NPDC050281 TaxID=3155515 RepID=UPI0034095FA5
MGNRGPDGRWRRKDTVGAALEVYLREAEADGRLGEEALVVAATARRLAVRLDSDDLPPYVVGALSRELRACMAQLQGLPEARPGLSEQDFAALLGELQ